MTWLAAFSLLLVGAYIVWTAGRLDRMHARVDAAWSALDAQLVRRAFAAQAVVDRLPVGPERAELAAAVARAVEAGEGGRERIENDLTRALRVGLVVAPGPLELTELRVAAERVGLARSFHNSAVRDTRALRRRKVPRLLRLAGHRALPAFFDVDDTVLG